VVAEVTPFDPALIEALRRLDEGALTLVSPDDDTRGAFLALLDSARESIVVAIYALTLPEAIDRLVAKHQAGLGVRLLLDYSQSTGHAERAQVARLRAAGVPLWIGTSSRAHQILHAKVTVVDELLVESGSWNYSRSSADQLNTFEIARSPYKAQKLLGYIDRAIQWIEANEPEYQVAAP
jgi:phosphatidylserine/phosphatidylglycerophosphate/cardiolipin synthase-like enzyme